MTQRGTPSEQAVRDRLRAQPESGDPGPAGGQPAGSGGPSPEPATAGPPRDGAAAAGEDAGRPAGRDPAGAAGEDAGRGAPSAADTAGGAGEDAGEHQPGAGPSVPDPLAEAERQRDEYLGLAQRTQASFENFRKRAARDAAMAGARAKTELVRELLPAIDNLERALASAGGADEGLVHGVRLVLADLVGALERAGIEAFEPAGERFDPQLHEAISMQPADNGAESGSIVSVAQKGYRLDDSVIRPARVVVAS